MAAPSSATTALDAAWNLLQSAYTGNAGSLAQLSQALIGWRAANFAGLSYNDQLLFAGQAFAHSLLGTNLREIEATLRAAAKLRHAADTWWMAWVRVSRSTRKTCRHAAS